MISWFGGRWRRRSREREITASDATRRKRVPVCVVSLDRYNRSGMETCLHIPQRQLHGGQ